MRPRTATNFAEPTIEAYAERTAEQRTLWEALNGEQIDGNATCRLRWHATTSTLGFPDEEYEAAAPIDL